MSEDNPLDKIVYSKEEIENHKRRHHLADLLKGRINLKNNNIIPTYDFENLHMKNQYIILILAKKALHKLDRTETDRITPKEISEITKKETKQVKKTLDYYTNKQNIPIKKEENNKYYIEDESILKININ